MLIRCSRFPSYKEDVLEKFFYIFRKDWNMCRSVEAPQHLATVSSIIWGFCAFKPSLVGNGDENAS